MFYLFWIPIAIIQYALYAIMSKKANDCENWSWVYALYVINIIGLWPLVARFSKNILFDGLIYDLIIMLTFYVTLIFMGAAKDFNVLHWISTGLVLGGMILFKLAS